MKSKSVTLKHAYRVSLLSPIDSTSENKKKMAYYCYNRQSFLFRIITTTHTHLHAYHSVNKKQHYNQQSYVWQSLEGLDKSPEERSDALASAQQLHQSHHTEQPKEIDGDDGGARLKRTKKHGISTSTFEEREYLDFGSFENCLQRFDPSAASFVCRTTQ